MTLVFPFGEDDAPVNGPSEATPCCTAAVSFLLPACLGSQGWRGRNSRSAVREFLRADSSGQCRGLDNIARLATATFSIRLFIGPGGKESSLDSLGWLAHRHSLETERAILSVVAVALRNMDTIHVNGSGTLCRDVRVPCRRLFEKIYVLPTWLVGLRCDHFSILFRDPLKVPISIEFHRETRGFRGIMTAMRFLLRKM